MRNTILALATLAMAATPAVALDGPGRALVASNTIRAQVVPAIAGNPGSGVGRAFIPPYSGTVRLTWQIRSQDGTEVNANAGTTHLDNCDRSTTSTAFVNQSCDLRVAGGMPVGVRAFAGGGNVVTLRQVKLRYNFVDSDAKAIVWEVPAVADQPPRP